MKNCGHIALFTFVDGRILPLYYVLKFHKTEHIREEIVEVTVGFTIFVKIHYFLCIKNELIFPQRQIYNSKRIQLL